MENERQRLERFRLSVDPEPAGSSWYIDEFGNSVSRNWFDRLTSNLCITTSLVAETVCKNPFNFLLEPQAMELPLNLDEPRLQILEPYLATQAGEGVARLAREVKDDARGDTLIFLSRLAEVIHQRIGYVVRPDGDPWDAEYTLGQENGSCRDVSVLFNETCRSVGIPARFISGYAESSLEEESEQYVHAWSEVFLPGAGWIAYDASLGLAVADQHLALACGVDHRGAAPMTGSFRGSGARSKLDVQLIIRTQSGDDDPVPVEESATPVSRGADTPVSR